jgi:hypothetical protein
MLLSRGPLGSSSKLIQIVLTIVVLALLLHFTHMSSRSRLPPLNVNEELPSDGSLSPEEHYLARLKNELQLTNETSWMSWRVQFAEEPTEWKSANEIHANFKNRPRVISMDHVNRNDVRAKGRLQLPVPNSHPASHVDASDLLFGVATTHARVVENDYAMVKAWSRWLTNGRGQSNGASIIIILDQAGGNQVEEVDSKLQDVGIDAYVTTTEEAMSNARRYYELAQILKTFTANLEANGQHKRWFGMVEDTVFFPGLSNLIDRLFSYNTDEKFYIGMPSEFKDWESHDDVLTTYGGGAVFLTRASLREIPRLPCFDTGASKGPVRAKNWDVLLQECIGRYVEWKMHVLPGFYSPKDTSYDHDISALETGLQPLLLHQAEGRHQLDVNKAHLVSNLCGETCFMQRYAFRDNWVLVNGVSISEYPDGLQRQEKTSSGDAEAADKTAAAPKVNERLIIDDSDDFDRRTPLYKGRRNVWRLMDSAVDKHGAVWQAYVKKADTSHSTVQTMEADSIDSVIVLIWENNGLFQQSR